MPDGSGLKKSVKQKPPSPKMNFFLGFETWCFWVHLRPGILAEMGWWGIRSGINGAFLAHVTNERERRKGGKGSGSCT